MRPVQVEGSLMESQEAPPRTAKRQVTLVRHHGHTAAIHLWQSILFMSPFTKVLRYVALQVIQFGGKGFKPACPD